MQDAEKLHLLPLKRGDADSVSGTTVQNKHTVFLRASNISVEFERIQRKIPRLEFIR